MINPQYDVQSYLLIPAARFFPDDTMFMTSQVDQLSKDNHVVNIIFVNAAGKKDIPHVFQREKEMLESQIKGDKGRSFELQEKLAYITDVQKMIGSSVYEKQAEKELLEMVSMSMDGQRPLTNDDISFLSAFNNYLPTTVHEVKR